MLYTLIIILTTSVIQAVFGVGVLLFGTPLLLLLGLDFQNVLSLLLPLSIAINIFQIKDNIHLIDFILFKKLVCFTLPLIVLILYFIKINNIDINLYIGLF